MPKGVYIRTGIALRHAQLLHMYRKNFKHSSESKRKIADALLKHGMINTPEYNSWRGMIQRCTNPNATKYSYYGGRGIKVCERWLDFRNFLADMGRKSDPALTIERIDNARGYEPGNCRWATRKEQCITRSGRFRTKFVKKKGAK